MSYPQTTEALSIARASYQALIEHGINPSLALLVSEVMGRDTAGMERSERDMAYVRQVVAKLNSITIEEVNAVIMPLQTEAA